MKFKNQQELWDTKWGNLYQTKKNPSKETTFAREVYSFLKNKNVKTILDLGCGDGEDSLFFVKQGLIVTALDFSKEALKQLQKTIDSQRIDNLTLLHQDITQLNLNQKFDAIFANLSLHYFDDKTTTAIFTKLHSLLNEDGYLFVRCKSTKDPLYGVGTEIETGLFNNNGKLQHLFSIDYLKEKLAKFELIEIKETVEDHLTMDKGNIKSYFVQAIAKKN